MEQFPEPSFETGQQELADHIVPAPSFPPKFTRTEERSNVWLRSAMSLGLYLIIGYYIFPSYIMLLVVTGIVVLHELGHFTAMKLYRYSDLGIFFIPLLGAYVSGTKQEVSQKQSAVILLAGPLPGIIIGAALYLIDINGPGYYPFGLPLSYISMLFILLNLINLFPVYPLDGGQLLNRLFLDEESWSGKIFVLLSAALLSWVALETSYILFIFPAMLLLRFRTDSKFNAVEKRIEEEGINVDIAYKDLPDEDYWKIRNILIEQHPSFRHIQTSPPYEYDVKEDKIMSTIQSLLHRHIVQDVSVFGKVFIFLLWATAIATPWLIGVDMSFLHRFHF